MLKSLNRQNSITILGLSLTALLFGIAGFAEETKPAPTAAQLQFFESKVRPLLIASCTNCHSKESAQGGLRLDAAVTPEKAKEIMVRVRGEGGKPRMPLGSTLPADKIGFLDKWVSDGAAWPIGKTAEGPTLYDRGKKHWSFKPLGVTPIPTVKNKSWVRNPIDAFTLSRLEKKGLQPSPTATRGELIRRLSYDLTGLPPSPEEVSAFLADKSPNAYEKLVDRLLASPHYGEKWARYWLDVVRYAETNSYERDNPKPNIFRYRDYVIRAFNDDKPYSRFVQEQIAGDEMPDGGNDGLIATAYYRLGIWDDEPADLQQAIFDGYDDLVGTTGQAFLGLTLDCARCHDHKLDPIPQKDYYRFVSLFRNINRFANGGATDEATFYSSPEKKAEYEKAVKEIDASKKAKQVEIDAFLTNYREHRAKLMKSDDLLDLKYKYFEGDWPNVPDFDKLKPVATGTPATPFVDLGVKKRNDSIGLVYEGFLNVPADGEYTFYIDSDDFSNLVVDGSKRVEKLMSGGQGQEQKGKAQLKKGRVPFRFNFVQGGGEVGLSVAWSGPGFARRPLSTLESCNDRGLPSLVAAELPGVLKPEDVTKYQTCVKEKAELDKKEPPVEKALIVSEAGVKAPDTFLLKRGDHTTPGDKVEPGFPICAGGGPVTPTATAKSTGRRLALANWLTTKNNPLPARVMANRIWQGHFGRGIVKTANDFGLQGAPPTHPELLNWLAKEFMDNGWSVKKLHRLILMSNTYKQSSRSNPQGLAKDPGNDLFWRFDMRRLTAEEIRDSMLAVSGSINLEMFGPCVYPEIPAEILAGQVTPGYDWDTAKMKPEDKNRRSLYIHVKRSLQYPLLASFDAPEADRSTALRFASTQPTQALGLMNGPLANAEAKLLASRVKKETGTDNKAFVRRMFSLVTQRTPTEAEVTEGLATLSKLSKRGATPEKAQEYFALLALNLDEFVYLD